ncbi:MAG: DNA replication/repair protein RecF [Chlamydiae bacterium]|nr:DNA replication/repair protein RecF [Chlamydiota bacterium]
MLLKSLRLCNFRNLATFEINFGEKTNIFYGNNGMGKTNLLEAIYLLSIGKSFRSQTLHDLIKHEEKSFVVQADFVKDNIFQTIKFHYDKKNKKIDYNSSSYTSFASLLGIIPLVLHTPTDIELITSEPNLRRRFLNIFIAQKDPLYVHHLTRFVKALKQRNYLLKTKNIQTIASWESELAKSAVYLTLKRKEAILKLNEHSSSIMQKLSSNHESSSLKYLSSITEHTDLNEMQNQYLKSFDETRKKELDLKCTLNGPHRDDFSILINSKVAKHFASEGQKNLFILALKLAEATILQKELSEEPILCFDDFGYSLDDERKNYLRNYLNNFSQVFITLPEAPKWEDSSTFQIKEGALHLENDSKCFK